MTDDKLEKIKFIVGNAPPNALANSANRRELGKQIAGAIGMWEGRVYDFLEEMRGLHFRKAEDRETFILFLQRGL